jgi:hypothetical protein
MRSFWLEPFLWIHLAGLAIAPLCLQIVWVALAVGDPLPLAWLEIAIMAISGIAPILWMQINKPFDIFSILLVALKPQEMSERQRKILSLFQRKRQKLIAWLGAAMTLGLLVALYQFAPVAAGVISISTSWRFPALLVAAIAFAAANLFLQVPLSVAGVLWTAEEQFNNVEPLTIEQIAANFTIPGFRIKKILPAVTLDDN